MQACTQNEGDNIIRIINAGLLVCVKFIKLRLVHKEQAKMLILVLFDCMYCNQNCIIKETFNFRPTIHEVQSALL